MRDRALSPGSMVVILLITVLAYGCGGAPSPSSPLATPGASISVLPTPQAALVADGVLFHSTADEASQGALEVCNPDGTGRHILADASPVLGEAMSSPGGEYVALFTADPDQDGLLTAWDVKNWVSLMNVQAAPESSESFFDAPPTRYLAWSPDSSKLAYVMGRDLHIADVASGDTRTLVNHREARYNLAGNIKGSIARPTWAVSGNSVVYDIFAPPDIRSGGADLYRDVEYVSVSDGTTNLLMEGARIVGYATTGHEVVLRHDDGRLFLLDLNTFNLSAVQPPVPECSMTRCNSGGEMCVSSCIGQDGQSRLNFFSPDGETLHSVKIAELNESDGDCKFQSVLWSPVGDSLLTTVGCNGEGVSLWSVRVADWLPAHLTDWEDVSAVSLLSWLK